MIMQLLRRPGGGYTDVFGRIEIGDNCFIGAHAIVMPGVSICANTIVAAGSVVTRSVHDENTIIGGNPAVEISSWDKYMERNIRFAHNVTGMSYNQKKDYLLSDKDKIKIK